MPAITPCPSQANWKKFVLGCLSSEQIAEMGAHLEQCPVCLQTMNTLHGEDSLTDALRQPMVDAASLPSDVGMRLKEMLVGGAPTLPPTVETDVKIGNLTHGTDLSFLSSPQSEGELGRLGGYRVLRVLGAGGMGMVFEAEDTKLERRVALKVMLPAVAARASARVRFLREARAAAALEHDNIVPIFQVGEENDVPFLAMPLLKGMSLEDRLQAGPPLSVQQVIELGKQVAAGLVAAHGRGLIHRDIKPGNLWLETKPHTASSLTNDAAQDSRIRDEFRVKILDFGLARAGKDDTQLTQAGAIVGTPAYMSPEQARNEAIDGRADLFSLGCVLYRLLTGRLPFRGDNTMATLSALLMEEPETPQALNPATPSDLSDLVMRLLSKDADGRTASADELFRTLSQIAKGDPTLATPNRRPEVSRRHCSRWWWAAAAILLILGPLTVLYSGTILRFATNMGELIVDIRDPNVFVSIEQNKLKLYEKTLQREFILEAGDGEVIVAEKNGLGPLVTKKFTLNRGGQTTVTVTAGELAEARKPQQASGTKVVAASPKIPPAQVQVLDLGPVPAGKSSFDAFRREDIPAYELTLFAGASPVTPPPELVAILGDGRMAHWSTIRRLAYSPKGDWLASYGGSDGLRIWDLATGDQKFWSAAQSSGPFALAFSHDGKRLAFTRSNELPESCTIFILDIASGKVTDDVRIPDEPRHGFHDLVFAPDDRVLFAAKGTAVFSYDLQGGIYKVVVREQGDSYFQFRFGANGKQVVHARLESPGSMNLEPGDRSIKVFDVASGELVASTIAPKSWIVAMHVDRDGQYVVMNRTGSGATPLLWNINANLLSTFHQGWIEGFAFSRDGRFMAAAGDGAISIYDPATQKLVRQLPYSATEVRPYALAWSPDGKTLSVVCDNAIHQVDTATWSLKAHVPGGERANSLRLGSIVGLGVAADGKSIITGDQRGLVNVWHCDGKKAETLTRLKARPDKFVVAPDGRHFASVGFGFITPSVKVSRLDIWNISNRCELAAYPNIRAWDLAFTGDGNQLLAGLNDLQVYDLAKPFAEVTRIPLSAKGDVYTRYIAAQWRQGILVSGTNSGNAGNPQGVILDGDRRTFVPWAELTMAEFGYSTPIASSPDGNLVALWAEKKGELHVFDAEKKLVRKLPRSGTKFLAFSPNSKCLAYGDNNQIHIASSTGKAIRTIRLRKEQDIADIPYMPDLPATFTPDGRHFVVGNLNGTIYVFRLAAAVE